MTAKEQQHAGAVSKFFFRVLVALLTINLATIAALIYIAYTFSNESLSKHARDNITQQVDILADKFDEEFRVPLHRSVRNLTNTPLLDDYLQGSEAERFVLRRRLERQFMQLHRDYPDFHMISFVESNRRIAVSISDGRRESPGTLLTNDAEQVQKSHAVALFKDLKETPLLLSSGNMEWFMPPREPQVSGPFIDSSGAPALLAGLGKLDKDTGLFGGVIMIQLNLDRWLDELGGIQFFDSNTVWVVDMEGAVLLKPKDSDAILDPRPYLPEHSDGGTHVVQGIKDLVVYRDLPVGSGGPLLRVAISLPADLLLRGISHAVDFFSVVVEFYAVVVVVSVILLAMLSYVIARYLARPVVDLAIARNQLADAQRIARLGHWEWDSEGQAVHFSDNALAILGGVSDARELDYKAFLKIVHPDDRAAFKQVLDKAREHGLPGSIEHRILVNDVEERFVHHEIDIIAGNQTQVIGTIQDISDRKSAEHQIRQLAYLDSVTGLANRTLLNELTQRALMAATEHRHRLAVMFLDLDHFKRINDTSGHDTGDQLLRQVANRLIHCVRPTDTVTSAPNWLASDKAVARLGGDEFIVLLPNIHDEEDARRIATRIQSDLTRPFDIGGKEISVTSSLGISIFPNHGQTMDDLLKHADTAMYQAKATGRNRFEIYTSAMDREIQHRLSIETRLKQAFDNEELVLYYQPRVDMKRGEIVAVEALLRWVDPQEGVILPGRFIKIAEETGLIVPIGTWVVRTACAQLRAWHLAGASRLTMSVNLSPIQFTAADLIGSISDTLNDTGTDPRYVELELTENALFENVDSAVRLAHDLKAYGLRLSIDDFGTGYSSLQLLKRLPVDTLKIDQSFVRHILTDSEDALIVKSAIALGQSLGLGVVAEGVEHHEQFALLRELNCDEAQGYLFGRPAPAEEVAAQLVPTANSATA